MDFFIIIPIVTGFFAGWAVNYLADVLPLTRRFSQPVCIHCNTTLSISTYTALARCPNCKKHRSVRTWSVQILALVTSIVIWVQPHPILGYFIGLILLIFFGVVFVIDLEHRLILHPVSMFGAVLGFGVGWLLHGLGSTLLGGLGGFGIMLIFYLFGTLFARIRAHRMRVAGHEPDDEEALGAGDVILAGVLGLVLGWPLIWFGLLIGILLGGLITIPMLVIIVIAKRYRQDAWMVFIPYGPFFLIGATLIVYFPELLSILVPK